jgi:hypothetical protein
MRGIARWNLFGTWLMVVGVPLIVVVGLVQGNVPWTLVGVDTLLGFLFWSMYRRYSRLAREEESSSDG